jgi:hypothetical protein
MNINDTFSGSLLKAADLNGAQPTVTIASIKMEKLGEDTKPVLYFAGKEKGVALNKTNATNISAAYGPETDHWIGKRVILFSAWVDFQGKSVEAIRIRPAPAQQFQQPQSYQPPAPPPQQHVPQFDNSGGAAFPTDDIPF